MPESSPQPWLDAIYRLAAKLNDAATLPVKRVRVQAGDASVEVEWSPGTGSARAATITADATGDRPAEQDGTFVISAPMVGTFYRAPEPRARPFVDVGDVVEAGQQIAILEAMKLMNPLEADRPGQVGEVLVADGESVEYGQPLFRMHATDEFTDE